MGHTRVPRSDYTTAWMRILRPFLYTSPAKIADAVLRDPRDFTCFVANDQSPNTPSHSLFL